MENWNEKQNNAFSKIFEALEQHTNAVYKADALTILKLNDENFAKTYKATLEITGEAEDIDLCKQRAVHLGLI